MNLLILGASGGCGRLLVDQALARGHRVTALVRPQTPFDAPPAVRVERGDVLAPGVLAQIVAGHDAVGDCLGIKRAHPANPWSAITSPPDLATRAATLLVDAMKLNGVRRVVAISTAGAGESAARMNLAMRFLTATSSIGVAYRDLTRMEEVFAASDLDWQAPRPTRLTDGPLTGAVRAIEDFPLFAKISRADVAGYLLDRLEGGELQPRTPTITAG